MRPVYLGGEGSMAPTDPLAKTQQPPIDQGCAVALATALRACLHLHRQMGIDRYPVTPALRSFLQPRRPAAPVAKVKAAAPSPARPTIPRPPVVAAPSLPVNDHLEAVRSEINACRLCSLGEAKISRCPGQGPVAAPLLVLGDYCGDAAAEDGIVFGVEEDALLWKMMQAIGLGPESVYCTNVCKCPCTEAEQALGEQACQDYLQREVALVQPRIVLAMGAVAARAALGREVSLLRVRGRLHPSRFVDRSGQPVMVMVSFHPRSLLEQPAMKKAAWQDLQAVQRQLSLLVGQPSDAGPGG